MCSSDLRQRQTMLDAAIDNLKAEIAVKQGALAVLEEQRALLTPVRKPRPVAPLLSEKESA